MFTSDCERLLKNYIFSKGKGEGKNLYLWYKKKSFSCIFHSLSLTHTHTPFRSLFFRVGIGEREFTHRIIQFVKCIGRNILFSEFIVQ